MNYSKIVGWLVFTGGLLIIAWTLLNSYSIFTMQAEAPEFFTAEEQTAQQASGQSTEAQLQDLIQNQLKGMIPTDTLPVVLNLAIWSILAFILIFGGSQIASLGIKLIKNAKSS
ncbi:MAG: hypothetical protein ABIA08_01510 [bacterium]